MWRREQRKKQNVWTEEGLNLDRTFSCYLILYCFQSQHIPQIYPFNYILGYENTPYPAKIDCILETKNSRWMLLFHVRNGALSLWDTRKSDPLFVLPNVRLPKTNFRWLLDKTWHNSSNSGKSERPLQPSIIACFLHVLNICADLSDNVVGGHMNTPNAL